MIAYSCRRTAKPPLPESRAAEAEARAAEASGEEATIKVVQGSTTRTYIVYAMSIYIIRYELI